MDLGRHIVLCANTQEGTIKELLFLEGHNLATYTPYQGRKVGDHAIVVAKDAQYIAIIESENATLSRFTAPKNISRN
ncbi:MAG: hypothetical protein WDO15_16290 [Bacteroidota bacterium]